jgi:hypothetical protein
LVYALGEFMASLMKSISTSCGWTRTINSINHHLR